MHENIHRQCVVEEVVEDVEGLEGGAHVGEVVGGEWTKGLRGRNLAMEAGVEGFINCTTLYLYLSISGAN